MGEGNENLVYSYLPALLPFREECVLRIFIALKITFPWPGSNPRPLCPVASTLITTPSRRLTTTTATTTTSQLFSQLTNFARESKLAG
jgi:hypothetical protein